MTRKMKDSGIEWIGEIPEEWEVTKLKRFVKIKSGDALDKKKFIDNGDIEVYGANAKLGNYDKSNIDKESIITGRVGTIGTLDIKANVWITDNVLAIDVFKANLKFIYYFLHILNFGELSSSTAQPLITATKLLNINIAFPTRINQNKISNYLDKKTKQIEDIKNTISNEIQTLEDYKKSVIIEAVTKGLDKNVEMKDSGIEWIGEIPRHWIVTYLKSFFDEGKNKNKHARETNLLSLSYGKIIKKDINTQTGLLPQNFNNYNIVEEGSIIIRPTDLQNDKKSLRTGLVNERGIITSAYINLKPKKNVAYKYFHYLLHSYDLMKVFYNMGSGVRQGLTYSEFSKLLVLRPSKLEQERIISYLDKETRLIDESIAIKQKQLETLEEYKKSLIYEYVTGKKEVEDGEES